MVARPYLDKKHLIVFFFNICKCLIKYFWSTKQFGPSQSAGGGGGGVPPRRTCLRQKLNSIFFAAHSEVLLAKLTTANTIF